MDEQTTVELEAAAFRRLVQHFRSHPEIQNIDLMILADFCRNCLSKWYVSAAKEKGIDLDYEKAREIIYGMPYDDWKKKHQTASTPEQVKAYEEARRKKRAKDNFDAG